MVTKTNSLDAAIEKNMAKFERQLNGKMQAMQAEFANQLSKQVKDIVAEISGSLGGGSLSNALGAGFGEVAESIARGKSIDKRNVANAVAKSFAPEVANFFKQSSSQMADEVSGFLGFGARNN